jgi:hypothetical protein
MAAAEAMHRCKTRQGMRAFCIFQRLPCFIFQVDDRYVWFPTEGAAVVKAGPCIFLVSLPALVPDDDERVVN